MLIMSAWASPTSCVFNKLLCRGMWNLRGKKRQTWWWPLVPAQTRLVCQISGYLKVAPVYCLGKELQQLSWWFRDSVNALHCTGALDWKRMSLLHWIFMKNRTTIFFHSNKLDTKKKKVYLQHLITVNRVHCTRHFEKHSLQNAFLLKISFEIRSFSTRNINWNVWHRYDCFLLIQVIVCEQEMVINYEFFICLIQV